MSMHAAAARRRMGELIGGTAGKDLVAETSTWMVNAGVQSPGRVTRALTPGFPDLS